MGQGRQAQLLDPQAGASAGAMERFHGYQTELIAISTVRTGAGPVMPLIGKEGGGGGRGGAD